MQGHIAKPVSAAELYSKLLELFRAKSIKIMRVDEDNIPEVNTQENEILDVVMGLDKCDNDVTIYQGMIKEFHEMYGDVIEKLYDLCEHDECKKARYLMMDIKDIAVNIGAYKLAEYCTTMENLLESDDIAGAESYKKHIEEFKTLLEKVFIAIDKYLESSH
jgi:HPt (histidine-containing phosphotransfer) domain-containing protein